MIRVFLQGGLGNQMFQYACGRSLSLKYQTPLILDLTLFNLKLSKTTNRDFELEHFKITGNLAYSSSPSLYRILLKMPCLYKIYTRNRLIVDRGPSSLNYFNGTISNCSLVGYWQYPKIFSEYSMQIKSEFACKSYLSAKSKYVISLIEQYWPQSVSLHVRRGDYLSASTPHIILPYEYYEKAINTIFSLMPSPRFYVFSDDIEWCRNHPLFSAIDCVYVDHNNDSNSWQDLIIMSKCKHHIVANSSFSWWGAWLSSDDPTKQTDSVVVCPTKWFSHTISLPDVCPSNWISL